jgi:hypothetical protein
MTDLAGRLNVSVRPSRRAEITSLITGSPLALRRRAGARSGDSQHESTLYTPDLAEVENRRFKFRCWVREIDPLHFSSPQLRAEIQKWRLLGDRIIPIWATTSSLLRPRDPSGSAIQIAVGWVELSEAHRKKRFPLVTMLRVVTSPMPLRGELSEAHRKKRFPLVTMLRVVTSPMPLRGELSEVVGWVELSEARRKKRSSCTVLYAV